MESEVCMNGLCGASLAVVSDYKKGWTLRSGGFANLCDKCGTAYEQLAFCELFHLEDTGWRECTSCGKRLHCGCIASSAFLELLDNGGVICISCSNSLGHNPKTREEKPKETGISVEICVDKTQSSNINNKVKDNDFNKIILLTKLNDEAADNHDASRSQMKHENNYLSSEEDRHNDIDNESLIHTNLTISLDASPAKPVFYPSKAVEERELKSTLSYLQPGTWSRHIFPKSILSQEFNPNPGVSSLLRVARPPVEGRVKNQLLPRYWPRITEQELQQISGDSNATVVPLFEKVLSASDAGRIGRLVLPKACAEAYFPPISQPEGLPLRVQDVKGKEWLFQFRFWPNNNSRMYVLEGVTPCIQSMQLQAGDTVTFSRMEPEGMLVMGFRKASTNTSGQVLKGSTYSHLNELPRNVNLAGSFTPSMLAPDKKRSRNIGSKSKRLLIESQDSLELKHTWEELQDMLFPPPVLKPNIVTIEDNEFEEYEEPPVFGKGSIFTVCSSGEHEQWAQCDICSKWRRLPADFLLPPTWTCQDNVWDQSRAVCLAPDEVGPRELENLLSLAKDNFYKRKDYESHKPEQEQEQGYNFIDAQTTHSMTTKHPRHRPGCSCIVCIQPASGKGKHKPTCTCNVCMTVKCRFKTLMLRKKKRQAQHEAIADKTHMEDNWSKGDLDLNIQPVPSRVGMMSLLQAANLPLETYLKQIGLTSLSFEQQVSSGSQPVLPQEMGETTQGGDEDDKQGGGGGGDEDDDVQDTCL